MSSSSISSHDSVGRPNGEFALFVDQCREDYAPRSEVRSEFESVRYDNLSDDRFFPLRNCSIRGAEIRGQMFWMAWSDCSLLKADMSHTRGVAHWTQVQFNQVNFTHLMARLSVAGTVFSKCRFDRIVLREPVFLGCSFVNCRISGTLIGASFVDCRFENVDLKGSRWEDPRMLGIQGTWKNADGIWENSSPEAKSFFLGSSTG